ncbi:Pyridoxamine kinase [Candidatus Terasakiella magnetica]|uniref:pyridoxal kinase n=1 Tax=Candidatus Terasakiella magnetica TaxID=1867952 RepID=A0A1C3RED9_9PROT|nr:pyridoxal kinase PdxY [Candidatus Terasakiella magnetica]SCA55594.1 Pyridoxamine kinase [Candidatus Terasakiella magnetica]
MSILSIQSSVAVGHVGNSAAMFPMQRLGFEVWAVPSMLFSNHPGYDSHGGAPVPIETMRAMVDGIDKLDHFDHCNAVLSGYLGTVEAGQFVVETVKRVKNSNKETVYFCDPVVGDMTRQLYVENAAAEYVRDELLPLADIIAPNIFELEYLTGRKQETLDDTLFAADMLRSRGPKTVLVTSVKGRKGSTPTVSNVVVSDKGAWRVTVPQCPLRAKGTGDVFAALFLAHLLRGERTRSALELATSTIFGIIDDTVRHDSDELRLIDAQAEYLHPSFYFDAVRVG